MSDTHQMNPARADAIENALRDVIRRDELRSRHAARRRLAWLVLPVTAGGLIFAASTARPDAAPITDDMSVACFARADFSGGINSFPGMIVEVVGEADANGVAQHVPQTDPVATCTSAWEQGELDPSRSNGMDNFQKSDQVTGTPDLTVCVLPDGIAGVVPGNEGTCAEMGLARAEG
jgi:hypothetical protein